MEDEKQSIEKGRSGEPISEQTPFTLTEDDLAAEGHQRGKRSRLRVVYARSLPFLCHLLVLAVYTAIIFSVNVHVKLRMRTELSMFETQPHDDELISREVEPFIEFEERIFDVLSVARPQHGRVPSPFEGPPTPENNERWKNLTDLMLYGATKKEAAELESPTIQAYDDPTVYPMIISVYHHLHCLDRLRRQAWGDVNPNAESEKYRLMHTDHCVENLRQALLCHGDTTPVPLFYTSYDTNGVPRNYDAQWDVPHTCRNANSLQEWAKKGHEVFKSGRLPNFIPVAGN